MTINRIDTPKTLEEIAEYLSQSNEYKVLKRFTPIKQYNTISHY